jgi:NAD(P)-dependent dehydrogenase (short-subunit alcohol dehydrogenase family)
MDTGLSDKAVVCTGAAGGIGQATAVLFAEEGARVLCVERTDELAEAALEALPGTGHAALAHDFGDSHAGPAVVEQAVESLGGVDVLAHLAAVMVPTSVPSITPEDWDLHMNVNARASFFLARAVAERMAQAGTGGRIVLASSGAWLSGGLPERLAYASSKGAVTTMVRGMAKAYGPKGITVNSVAPGLVDTAMMRNGLDDATRLALEAATPLGRFGRPAEIASCVVFLASTGASFISGATLNVSGGFTLY